MLSKKSGKLFKIVIRWCNVCGGMPFVWNGRRGHVTITRKGQLRWGTAFIVQTILCFYTYVRLYQIVTGLGSLQQCNSVINTNSKPVIGSSSGILQSTLKLDAEIAYCFLHVVIHTYMIAISVNTLLNQKKLVLFTNSYLKFTSHFRGILNILH